jgi:leucyl-tRNA synthetase
MIALREVRLGARARRAAAGGAARSRALQADRDRRITPGNIPEWVRPPARACRSCPPRNRHHAQLGRQQLVLPALCDPRNDQALADMEKLRYWMPVDVYIGGDEHNTLHLLYSRFIYQFLHDIGAVPPNTPSPTASASRTA